MEPDRDDPKVARVLAEAPWLRRLAGRLDGDRADDLAQEALLAALAGPAPRGRLRAWLAAILRNLARDARRRDLRRTRREERAARRDSCGGPAELAARAETHARVMAAVRELPEPLRTTVLLHFLEGLSLAEIARREGGNDSTTRNRLRRALARLRERLRVAPLAVAPLACAPRPRLSLGRVAAAAALLAGVVCAGTPREPDPAPPPAVPQAPPPLPEPPPVLL